MDLIGENELRESNCGEINIFVKKNHSSGVVTSFVAFLENAVEVKRPVPGFARWREDFSNAGATQVANGKSQTKVLHWLAT